MAPSLSDAKGPNRVLASKRRALLISTAWSALFLLASSVLSTYLGIIREFESGIEFNAHNRLHSFRPVTFFWFDRFAILPSVALAALIYLRHALGRDRRSFTWVLAFFTSLLLALGAYTVWETFAMMHCFVQ